MNPQFEKLPCEGCGEVIEHDQFGVPAQYHDHKDLRYWKDRAEKAEAKLARAVELLTLFGGSATRELQHRMQESYTKIQQEV